MADGRGAEMRWTSGIGGIGGRGVLGTSGDMRSFVLDWLCLAIALHLDYPAIIAVITIVTVVVFCP